MDREHQAAMWRTLRGLAEAGLTVIAACADPAALVEDTDAAGRDLQGPLPLRPGSDGRGQSGERAEARRKQERGAHWCLQEEPSRSEGRAQAQATTKDPA
jgi:hypothetical protein